MAAPRTMPSTSVAGAKNHADLNHARFFGVTGVAAGGIPGPWPDGGWLNTGCSGCCAGLKPRFGPCG
jgi:hypothetical protein